MQVSKQTIYIILAMILFVVAPVVIFAFISTKQAVKPGQYANFAACLTDRGVKMYGAYWCPHCSSQKKLFGDSFNKVTYIECSLPGGQAQIKECQEAGIKGYPTWEFSDSSRLEGEIPLQTLAEKSGCNLESGGGEIINE